MICLTFIRVGLGFLYRYLFKCTKDKSITEWAMENNRSKVLERIADKDIGQPIKDIKYPSYFGCNRFCR